MKIEIFLLVLFAFVGTIACQNPNNVTTDPTAETDQEEFTLKDFTPPDAKPLAVVDDEELMRFAKTAKFVLQENTDVQQRIYRVLEKHDLTAMRYTEILQTIEVRGSAESNATPDEIARFEKASKEIEQVQIDSYNSVIAEVEAAGFTEERYQQIAWTLQEDRELNAKFVAMQAEID